MPIDLAPNHKVGLSVANPILLAGGSIGYGEAVHPSIDLKSLGGVVVGPVLLQSRAGSAPPRLAQTTGGFIVETGLQNRGIDSVLRNFAKSWPRLGCPVIVQVADQQPNALARVVERLDAVEGVAGLELLLPRLIDPPLVRSLIRTITQTADLPVWVKPTLDQVVELAALCIQNEAVGLVIGRTPVGMVSSKPLQPMLEYTEPSLKNKSIPIQPETHPEKYPEKHEAMLTGSLYGPLVFPQMLNALNAVVKLQLGCALIACGGIHTPEHVRQALDVGADAVQIDSAIWVEPGLPQRLVKTVRQ